MDAQTNPEHLPDTQSGLQNPCVKTSTIVGEFRTGDEHALSLKPLLMTVCFQGTLPRQLAHQGIIKTWLITKVSMSSQHWTWGRDAFWLAFIAAYPAFPGGKWCMWNSKIVPVGEFVEQWLSMSHPAQAIRDLPDWRVEMRRYIMEEFCKHASLFHPTPIPELR
ncbi:hypothetical protein BDN67DRAFT_981162 [Paxillus ammoniavirescens]|nr:hypothetical protein BDN67DRAFT_981162 [Paxillus ammoniavirescens]